MAFQQMARATAPFAVCWGEDLTARSFTRDDVKRIAAFLLRNDHPLRPESRDGTLTGACFYVQRLLDYHARDLKLADALAASTLVSSPAGSLLGCCLLGGGGANGQEFGIYDIVVDPGYRGRGIGTRMIQRALGVLDARGIEQLHVWCEDESRAATLYARLGFVPTGQVA